MAIATKSSISRAIAANNAPGSGRSFCAPDPTSIKFWGEYCALTLEKRFLEGYNRGVRAH